MSREPFERRDVLKLAAAACIAGVEAGCASPQRARPASASDVASQLDPAAADALLAKIDRRMESLKTASLPDDVLPLSRRVPGAQSDAELAASGELVRKAIRTLYLTGRFLDMPDELKVHPGVQARLRAMQPEMDDAVLGMTARLERMTADDHRRVQGHLQNDDLFGERLARALEKTAKDDGLSFQRTFGVRSATLDLSQRMSAQSPALVTDPIVRKVRRIEAHPRTDAETARLLAARVGEQAFWAHQERLAVLHEAWASRLGTAQAVAGDAYTWSSAAPDPAVPAYPPAPPRPIPPTTGQKTLKAGGITMGLGAGSVVVGLILGGLASVTGSAGLAIPALVLGVTIGPILLVVGLIIVIVGAVIRLSE